MNEKYPEPSTSKQERRQSTTRYLKLNRLPTLQEVLDRRTRPPLDLFCFYIFLQRESAEDALDFWLDVQQHENMCKAYFKDLRRSDRTIDEDWPEYATYARNHNSHFSPLLTFSEKPLVHIGAESTPSQSHARSSGVPSSSAEGHSTPLSHGRERRDTESHGARSPFTPSGAEFGQTPRDRPSEAPTTGTGDGGNRGTMASRMSIRNWARDREARKSKAPTIIQRDRAVQKEALEESAERIYLRYLLPGAEKEIYLPPSLRMPDFPSSSSTHPSPLIPDMFHQQKHYIFRALEADAFPRFLRAKAFANLSPAGSFWRLIMGLLILWGGFVLGFSLIFLDRQPRALRVWVLLPFLIASNLLLSAYYSLSPLLALFQQSETGAFRSMRVRESYVRRLLSMRAVWIELVCLAITAGLTCIFVFVPGRRL